MQNDDVGLLIKQISDRIRSSVDQQLKEVDLTFSQGQILKCLHMNEGRMTQKELEVSLNVSHPTIVGLIARLEKKGFVSCTAGKGQRSKMVMLTDRAELFHQHAMQKAVLFEQTLTAGFSKSDRETLVRLLQQVYQNLSETDSYVSDGEKSGYVLR